MRIVRFLIPILIISFISCEKNDVTDSISGEWKLVEIYDNTTSSNI